MARVDEAESMLEKNMREKKGGKDAKVVGGVLWGCAIVGNSAQSHW